MPLSQFVPRMTLLSLLLSIPLALADSYAYQQNAGAAANHLIKQYDQDTGLWYDGKNPLWWNSANALTAIIDLAAADATQKLQHEFVLTTTFAAAPAANPQASRKRSLDGSYHKDYVQCTPEDITRRMVRPRDTNFLNGFYDDEGWWALAWLDAYDLTGDLQYLLTATSIWRDMQDGATTNCGSGSIWWDKQHTYVASISNELFFHLSASLANRINEDDNHTYLTSANKSWNWFKQSGIIRSDNLLVDGLDKNCKPTGTTFTYNQGVILGALVELSRATNNATYLDEAVLIANAATKNNGPLVTNAHLHEPNWCDGTNVCGTFKGVFVRNLRKLQNVRPSDAYKRFLEVNAQSIWSNDSNFTTDGVMLGPIWAGPFQGSVNIPAHVSGLECLTAAFVVS